MPKTIDIEYCGSWGYGGPALRLKMSIQKAFPNVAINSHSANGQTGKIVVSVVDAGKNQVVWSEGKASTENNHAKINQILKGQIWWIRRGFKI